MDKSKPGYPTLLIQSLKPMAELLRKQNPAAIIWLEATWSRANQTYRKEGHWQGKPIDVMPKDIRAGYGLAAANSTFVRGVIPVIEAWNRAMAAGAAHTNPRDGIAFGQVELWTHDHYHGSTYGYYLGTPTIFGNGGSA